MIIKRKILIADDELVVLKYYQKLLGPLKRTGEDRFQKLSNDLFGETIADEIEYDLVTCSQGEEALELVEKSLEDKEPFACALLDVRMPPGKGGVWAAEQIRKIDQDVHIAIITAYADTDIREISEKVPPADKLLFTVKPVHPQELVQLVAALSAKWISEKEVKRYKQRLSEKIELQANSLIELNKALVEDLEKQRLIEQKLQKHSAVFNIINEAVIVTDINGMIQEVNPAFYDIFSIDYYVSNLNIKDIFNILENRESTIGSSIKENQSWSGEIPFTINDGSQRWFKTIIRAIETIDFKGLIYVVADITDDKRKETLMNQQKKLLEEIFTRVGQGIAIVDEDERILLANPALSKILNTSSDEMKGKNFLDYFSDEDAEKKHLFSERRKNQEIIKFEIKGVTDAGEIKDLEIISYPRYDNNNAYIGSFAVVIDVTENKIMLNRSVISQKMEAMGRLAGGIAHDFNNTLTVINTAMELLKTKYGQKMEDNFVQNIDEIIHSADYAKDLVDQLSFFSGKKSLEKTPINLNSIISDSERLIKRIAGNEIKVSFETDNEIGNINADISQIKQLLVNFTENSRDTIQTKGSIDISTKRINFLQRDKSDHSDIKEGEYVLLTFKDNGKGFSENLQKKVFEPFSSANENEKTSGLGLAIIYNIVQNHQGIINVESIKGVGTIFSVYFPVCENSADTETKTEQFNLEIKPATILMVEDDRLVRKFTSSLLRYKGYKVFEADCTKIAREIFRIHKEEIDILFSNILLSDGSGIMLTDELSLKKVNLRCYLTSGYNLNERQLAMINSKGIPFLKKPYTTKELLLFLNTETAFVLKESDKCEMITTCAFLSNFQGEEKSILLSGWQKMFCDKIEKSQRCERKKYYFLTGTEPDPKLTPTGKMLDLENIIK